MTITLLRDTNGVPYFGADGANNIVLLSGGPSAAGITLANGMTVPISSLIGAVGVGYNGTSLDLLQTLAASGFGLGVQRVAGTLSSTDYTATPRSTTLATPINVQNDKGVNRRLLSVYNPTDQPIQLIWTLVIGGMNVCLLTATLAQHATYAYNVTANGIKRTDGTSTGVTNVNGDYAMLALPFDTVTVAYQYAIAPTSGTLAISYRGQT